MPITDDRYVAPNWENGTDPAIDADELRAISQALEWLPVANGGTGNKSFDAKTLLEGNGTDILKTRVIVDPLFPANVHLDNNISGIPTIRALRNTLRRSTAVSVADTNLDTPMVRGIYAGTEDMQPGVTPLTAGVLYFVYE